MTALRQHPRLQGGLALLYGGRSAERAISLQSGAAIKAALERLGLQVHAIDTASEGWLQRWPEGCRHALIALHGPGGEDGSIQGALQQLGVGYTGSGVLASALAMDKLRSKQLWRGLALPTPDFVLAREDTDWAAVMADFGVAFVKPVREGSSIGMARVTTAAELEQAWAEAARYDSIVLVERAVMGPEYTVAILGEAALPVIQVETERSFYDYQAKYHADTTRYHCPSDLSAEAEAELQQLALTAYRSLGCRDWGRVDIMAEPDGTWQLLEVNTVPGMTDHSLVPMAARAAGLSFDELVAAILHPSLTREETRV